MSLQKNILIHKWKRRKLEHNTKTNITSTSMEYQPVWVPPFDSVDRFSCGCRDAMVSGQNRCAACLLLPLPELLVFLVLELLPCRLLPEPGWSVDEGFEASNIGCRMRRRALMNQLFTCSNVRFVCAAIWRFSSSVGYGCCNTRCYWSIWILHVQTSLQSESVFRASLFMQKPGTRLQVVWLTTRCWNSHDRMTLVACLGRTPRFCFFLLLRKSSSSSIDPGVVGAGDSWPATNIMQKLAYIETSVEPSCCY